MLFTGLTVTVTRVDLGLHDPAAQRFRADAFLTRDGRDRLCVRGVLGPMLNHEPDGSFSEHGIDLLWHDCHPFNSKEAASNLGRFN